MISAKALLKLDMDPVRLLRIFTVIPVVLILLAGAGALWIYFFVHSLLPQGQSLVETPGLTAEVKVVRDRNGVPGIIAEREEDLALVLGYVMAQDRLWQMDYLRRAGSGRLTEILGRQYLDGDHLIRMVRAGTKQDDYLSSLDEKERRWLDQFVQGINRYIVSRSEKLPVEFSLLEYRPALFSAEDVASICSAVAWESSVAARVDPVMTRILGRLGKDRALALFPTDPAGSHELVASDLQGWEPAGIFFSRPGGGSAWDRMPGLRSGAAWVVSGDRSLSRHPITACSVYQTFTAPGFWYRARLATANFQLSGAFIPGIPAALVGTNERINWGCISAPADDADLFIERCDSDSPSGYWRVDRWRKLHKVTEKYRLRGGSSVSRTISLTETGPLVSDVDQKRALSLRWTGREGTGLFPALFRLNRAGSGKEIKSALKGLVAPCLNVVWADKAGDYGIQTAGRIPVRAAGSDGIVPMPGWTGVNDWCGYVPFDELPSSTNPGKGFAVVSDDRPGGKRYPYLVSCYWNDRARAARIVELLQQAGSHSRESFQKIHADTLSPLARELTPLLLAAMQRQSGRSPDEEAIIRLLASWDFEMKRESPAAAFYGMFLQALLKELFLEPLGDKLFKQYTAYPPLASRAVREIFLNNRTALPAAADHDKTLVNACRKAIAQGKSLLAADPTKWKWGDLHTASFRHPLASRSKFLEVSPVSPGPHLALVVRGEEMGRTPQR